MRTVPGIPSHPFLQRIGTVADPRFARSNARIGCGYGVDSHRLANPEADHARKDDAMAWLSILTALAVLVLAVAPHLIGGN